MIGVRHRCSGHLLQPQPIERTKSPERPVRTIDERVADCPVCAAKREKDAKRQQKHRVKKTIPGQR